MDSKKVLPQNFTTQLTPILHLQALVLTTRGVFRPNRLGASFACAKCPYTIPPSWAKLLWNGIRNIKLSLAGHGSKQGLLPKQINVERGHAVGKLRCGQDLLWARSLWASSVVGKLWRAWR